MCGDGDDVYDPKNPQGKKPKNGKKTAPQGYGKHDSCGFMPWNNGAVGGDSGCLDRMSRQGKDNCSGGLPPYERPFGNNGQSASSAWGSVDSVPSDAEHAYINTYHHGGEHNRLSWPTAYQQFMKDIADKLCNKSKYPNLKTITVRVTACDNFGDLTPEKQREWENAMRTIKCGDTEIFYNPAHSNRGVGAHADCAWSNNGDQGGPLNAESWGGAVKGEPKWRFYDCDHVDSIQFDPKWAGIATVADGNSGNEFYCTKDCDKNHKNCKVCKRTKQGVGKYGTDGRNSSGCAGGGGEDVSGRFPGADSAPICQTVADCLMSGSFNGGWRNMMDGSMAAVLGNLMNCLGNQGRKGENEKNQDKEEALCYCVDPGVTSTPPAATCDAYLDGPKACTPGEAIACKAAVDGDERMVLRCGTGGIWGQSSAGQFQDQRGCPMQFDITETSNCPQSQDDLQKKLDEKYNMSKVDKNSAQFKDCMDKAMKDLAVARAMNGKKK